MEHPNVWLINPFPPPKKNGGGVGVRRDLEHGLVSESDTTNKNWKLCDDLYDGLYVNHENSTGQWHKNIRSQSSHHIILISDFRPTSPPPPKKNNNNNWRCISAHTRSWYLSPNPYLNQVHYLLPYYIKSVKQNLKIWFLKEKLLKVVLYILTTNSLPCRIDK